MSLSFFLGAWPVGVVAGRGLAPPLRNGTRGLLGRVAGPHGDAVAAGRTGTRRSEQHLLGMATAVATLVCTDNYSIERREAWYATESYERGMMHAMELQQRIG